ncbi:MAG: hypothetical protein LC799_02440 [Actinobacteria bacterium]|nr:hypothetical protein [Actinomycetota bacterium]
MPWTATRDGEARAYRVGSTSVLTAPHVIKGAMSVRVRFTSREICNRIMISGRPAQVDRWHYAPPRVILRTCCEYRTGWSVWIETVELDDRNIAHATTRVSAAEICEVFDNDPAFCQNRSGRTTDYVAIGVTYGGSRVRVNFIYYLARRTARPVSAWRLS